ncbi:MAG: c-type cytochrome [Pedosphaera sp.]|nr:c-type cytochrome [Pedosphaera sp.]
MIRPLVCASLLLFLVGFTEPVRADAKSDTLRIASLERLIRDPNPRVRLEALRSLARLKTAESAQLALQVLELPMDPTLDYALWLTINDLSEPWIAALQSGRWDPTGRDKQLAFALKSIRPEQASRVLGKALADNRLTRDGSGPWIELIGAAGAGAELGLLYTRLLEDSFSPTAATRALQSLAEASRSRRIRPTGDLKAILKLIGSKNPEIRAAALQLAGLWKSLSPSELNLVGLAESDPSDTVKATAFDVLRTSGDPSTPASLARLATSKDPSTQIRAALAWAALDINAAAKPIVEVLKTLDDESRAIDFWRAVLSIKGAGKIITNLLPESGLPPASARAGVRAAREGGRSDVELASAIARSGGLAADAQAFTTQWIRDLAAKTVASGDPLRGESVYRRPELACLTCHAIGGAGGRVGPDMTSIGASAPLDYLIESVLKPDAKIKEGYHGVIVDTKDGQTLSGTVVRESGTELVLRSPSNQELILPKSTIEHKANATASLMPGGLIDALSEAEQADIFAFLSRLGKPGDFDASRGGVARRWRLANLVHTDVQNGQGDWMWSAKVTDRRWTEIYSRVNGDLTRSLMEGGTKANFWISKLAVLAMTEITLPQAGRATFSLIANPTTELWIDGKKVLAPVQLTAGIHRVIVKLDPARVPERIRLETADASFKLD